MSADHQPQDRVRIDKWLWAARFFKTRSLAAEAVTGGKVHLNGERVKAARALKPGDRLDIRKGQEEWTVVVEGLSDKRGPAREAVQLYQETPDSLRRRQETTERRRLAAFSAPRPPASRPNKKDRRQIIRFIRKDGE